MFHEKIERERERVKQPGFSPISKLLLIALTAFFGLALFLPSAVRAAYRDTIQAEGTLLDYWPMDEASSPIIPLTGAANITATGAGITFAQEGQIDGTSVAFNGVTGNASTTAIDLSSHAKIVAEFLLYWNSYANNDKLALEFTSSGSNAGSFTIDPNGSTGTFLLLLDAFKSTASYTRPAAGAWHHMAAVFDPSKTSDEIDLYIDGVLQTPLSRPINGNSTRDFANSNLYLMSRGGTSLLGAGKMQHLALYSDLSSARILVHAQEAGLAGLPLVAGTVSTTTQGIAATALSWTASSGGTSPVTSQLQRSLAGAGTWSDVTGATVSPFTDTGLTPSTIYDYRVAYTDSAPETAYSNTLTITTNTGTVIPWSISDLLYNDRDGTETPRHSAFATLKFTTDDSTLEVVGNSDIADTNNNWSKIGVRIDGVNQSSGLTFTSNGSKIFTVDLGAAGTSRTVEIIDSLQSQPTTVLGSYIVSVAGDGGSSRSLVASSTSDRVLVYGDSISVGSSASVPPYTTWTTVLRNTYDYNLFVEGWGYRSLYTDANTSELRTAFVNKISSINPETIYLAIGTNDYGIGPWSASSFGTAYAALLDDIHTALPTARIICQTPLLRSTETANGFGNTLEDYRTQISTACSARAWTTLIDGTTLLTLTETAGLHPTDTGNAKYADRTAPILASTGYTVSGPTTGLPSEASTNFTVTLAAGAPFLGDQTVTLVASDGTIDATATGGSVSGNGSGDVTVTPASTTTNFTFTYTPASNGTKTLTFTNSQNWINPSTATYTASIPDSTPPSLSAGSPSGSQSAGTTQVTMSLTTDESATCKYGTTASTAYADIASTFTTTGGTSHSQTISSLSNGSSYTYYIRCTDGSNPNTSDYTISFSVASGASSGGGGASFAGSPLFGTVAYDQWLAARRAQEQTVVTPPAEDRQTQLATLQAQLAALQKMLTNLLSESSAQTSSLTDPAVTLTLNRSNPLVKVLQQALNRFSFIVSKSGPGSAGQETDFFGPATKAAIIKLQLSQGVIKNAKEDGAGLFGPKTKKALKKLLEGE